MFFIRLVDCISDLTLTVWLFYKKEHLQEDFPMWKYFWPCVDCDSEKENVKFWYYLFFVCF